MQDIFVEQIGHMVVGAGVVRIDFMRLGASDPGKQGQFQPGLRLVMPLPAFAQAVDEMNKLRDQLVADGALTKTLTELPPVMMN